MSNIDFEKANTLLEKIFLSVCNQCSPSAERILNVYKAPLDTVFESKTQSYREVILGCALVHIIDPDVNIRLPYVKQGSQAFCGRSLDENVVNPFLVSKQIPSSKGPYLATFRRNVRLDLSARSGLRDQIGYDAMLTLLDAIEASNSVEESEAYLESLLKRFIILREKSTIQLARIARMSVEQYHIFLDTLLHNHSGGLIPLLLAVAIFKTQNKQYSYGWVINWQGINTADGATGAPGDITLLKNDDVIKAIEVTERPINQSRIVTTFNTKIVTNNVRDYLFIYTDTVPDMAAYKIATKYFAQGYDINYIRLSTLILTLFTFGDSNTRTIFTDQMLNLLNSEGIPASIKTAWNDSLQVVIDK